MNPTWMLMLGLMVPPPEQAIGKTTQIATMPSARTARSPSSGRDRDELRAAYRSVMRKSAARAKPVPADVVPPLVALYKELRVVRGMSYAEKSRLRHGVESRLEQQLDKLLRERVRHQRQSRRADYLARKQDRKGRPTRSLAGGGSAAARAQELIDLIQTVIQPDSWEINGGNGRIYYFSLLQALVVRQTAEVHHELGGGLGALRQ